MGDIANISDAATRCTRCSVTTRSLCGLSDLASQTDIARISGRRFVGAGQTILANGGDAGLVGTVLAGVLKVSKTLPNGRERIVSLIYPGDFFGQLFDPVMDFAVEAATDAEICSADRTAYEGLLARHPKLEHALLLVTANHLALARERALLLSCQNSLERVATYLLVMAGRRDHLLSEMEVSPLKSVAALMITRADLASYLGTTFETISRHLHYLADKQVIAIIDSGHFEIIDPDRLQSIAGVSNDDLRLFLSTPRQVGNLRRQLAVAAPVASLFGK
jgi:CRP/FNR family transcriptional regulator